MIVNEVLQIYNSKNNSSVRRLNIRGQDKPSKEILLVRNSYGYETETTPHFAKAEILHEPVELSQSIRGKS